MPLRLWKYEKVETRDDIKTEMPDHWKVDVYKVTAGEEEGKKYSGQPWYVQVLSSTLVKGPTRDTTTNMEIYLCNCPPGTFRAPLSVVGLGPQCKHAENLAAYLKERKK